MGEMFNAMKDVSKKKREINRESSLSLLKENGVEVEVKNDGAHLIITSPNGKIDFWPGTGKYMTRSNPVVSGRGVRNLLRLIR